MVEDAVPGHEAPAADAKLRVAFGGEDPLDQFYAGPNPARVLPAAAGPAKPFAQDRPRQHQPTIVFLQGAGERRGLAGCPHADADKRGQEIGGNSQA